MVGGELLLRWEGAGEGKRWRRELESQAAEGDPFLDRGKWRRELEPPRAEGAPFSERGLWGKYGVRAKEVLESGINKRISEILYR